MRFSAKSPDSPQSKREGEPALGSLGQFAAIAGFVLYAVFAPHSVAAADISIAIATVGWFVRTIATRRTGLRHTEFDLPILLFLLWTAASSFLSQEPAISVAKLEASWAPLVFYMAHAVITRRTAVVLVSLLILSGVAGTLYSLYDLARGRGIIIESISNTSPLQSLDIKPGDTIWRIDGHRVYSTGEIDDLLRKAAPGKRLAVSVISSGEHVERTGLLVTREMKDEPSPSGITGYNPSHRFRASGWTRHYETFSELLQIIAQLSLGLALANLRNHGKNSRFKLAIVASGLLSVGIVLTAMRTVLVAFALGAGLIVCRSLQGRAKLVLSATVAIVVIMGGIVVWQTRAQKALELGDPSSSLRAQVARVGLSRIMQHPVFGHGLDAVHLHWSEWGFPGKDMIHLHSTPLQIAFDRGLPALAIWFWIVVAFWLRAARAERAASDSSDTNRYGLLLGTVGALTGLLASSLVNYNFGDAEVALLFWWLMGMIVALTSEPAEREMCRQAFLEQVS